MRSIRFAVCGNARKCLTERVSADGRNDLIGVSFYRDSNFVKRQIPNTASVRLGYTLLTYTKYMSYKLDFQY